MEKQEVEQIVKAAQSEVETLKALVRSKDQTIDTLKRHCEVLRINFKSSIELIAELSDDIKVKTAALSLIESLKETKEMVTRL